MYGMMHYSTAQHSTNDIDSPNQSCCSYPLCRINKIHWSTVFLLLLLLVLLLLCSRHNYESHFMRDERQRMETLKLCHVAQFLVEKSQDQRIVDVPLYQHNSTLYLVDAQPQQQQKIPFRPCFRHIATGLALVI